MEYVGGISNNCGVAKVATRKGYQMSRAIQVKVATEKVVVALKETLAKKQGELADYDKSVEKFEKAKKDWQSKALALAIKSLSKASEVSVNARYDGRICISAEFNKNTIEIGDEPTTEPQFRHFYRGNVETEINELASAIRILEMSDDEFVNASTMKSLSQYL